jgi:hypothetical protein
MMSETSRKLLGMKTWSTESVKVIDIGEEEAMFVGLSRRTKKFDFVVVVTLVNNYCIFRVIVRCRSSSLSL